MGARMGGPDVDVWRRLRFLPRSGAGETTPSHRSQRSAESSVLLSSAVVTRLPAYGQTSRDTMLLGGDR